MKDLLWLGTEASFTEYMAAERWIEDNAIDLMDRRQAFFDSRDEEEDRKGAYLVEHLGNGVSAIKIHGSLKQGYSWIHEMMPGRVTSYEAIGDALDMLVEDDSVDKILLDVSSGGGAVAGIDAISQRIRQADSRKPVVAHTSTNAFSAAYWLASSAREVTATRMAEVGSIGTLMVHQSMARMAEEKGIDITVFRAGRYKAIGLPYEQLSDEAKEYLQADIEKANSFFLEHVSLRRNLTMSSKGIWAEGKTFFAEEGQGAGLVDRITSLSDLVSASGAASTHRRKPMLISDEKRAQIAAGAQPEDVLTAEELKQYQAELESGGEAEAGEGETPSAGDGEAGTEASEEPEPTAASGFGEGITAEYRQALKDQAKAEARAEAAEEKIAALEAKQETLQSQMTSLQEIGKLAVNNLQTALGKPKESAGTAEGMVKQFNDLQTEMSARFSRGRQSQEPKDPEPSAHIPLAFRHRISQ